jgi:hypothetical protein
MITVRSRGFHNAPSATALCRTPPNRDPCRRQDGGGFLWRTTSAQKCSDKGYSFDLTNGENVLMSAMQLPVPSRCGLAVANAKLVKPQMGGG